VNRVAERLVAAEVGRVVLDDSSARTLVQEAIGNARGTLFGELHGFGGRRASGALSHFFEQPNNRAEFIGAGHVGMDKLTREFEPAIVTNGFVPTAAPARAAEEGRLSLVASPDLEYPHSKIIASTGGGEGGTPTALFNNVKMTDLDARRPDIAITLTGRTANAAVRVIDAQIHGTTTELAAAVDEARASAGLIYNEPRTGQHYLADAQYQLLGEAKYTYVMSSKGLDSVPFARALVEAQQRGVKVGVSVRDLSRDAAQVLDDAHVPLVLQPRDTREFPLTRVNLALADDETALVSTAYQWTRQLAESADGIYPRDSGIVLRGAALDQLRPQLTGDRVKVVGDAFDLIAHPEHGTSKFLPPNSWGRFDMRRPLSLPDARTVGSQFVKELE
jgi:hypothetical protein